MAQYIFLRRFRIRIILSILFCPINNWRKVVIVHYSKELLRWAMTFLASPRQILLRNTSNGPYTFLALLAACLAKLIAFVSVIHPGSKTSLRHQFKAFQFDCQFGNCFARLFLVKENSDVFQSCDISTQNVQIKEMFLISKRFDHNSAWETNFGLCLQLYLYFG